MTQIFRYLKQIASIRSGHAFRGSIEHTPGSGTFAVQLKDTSVTHGIDWRSCIETELPGKRQPEWLMPGDILFAARGSQYYAVAVDDSIAPSKYVASPHFFVIQLDYPELALPEYIAFLLNYGTAQRYLDKEAAGTLTKSIKRGTLENAPLHIPSIPEQQAAASAYKAILEERRTAEQLIENGQHLLTALATDLNPLT